METVELKNMPFIAICRELLIYSLLVELCSGNDTTTEQDTTTERPVSS